MKHRAHCMRLLACAALTLGASVALAVEKPAPAAKTFTRKQVKAYFDMEKELHPEKGDQFLKLVELVGDHKMYKAEELTAITNPLVPVKDPYEFYDDKRNEEEVIYGGWPAEKVRRYFATIEQRDPAKGDLWKALLKKYHLHKWYYPLEVSDVAANGDKPKGGAMTERDESDPVYQVIKEGREKHRGGWTDFKSPRIRQNWRDVLYDEDASVTGGKAALGDLVGASFAYSHDGRQGSDTWSAVGVVISPWVHHFEDEHGNFSRVAIAPSVSINRVDTSGKTDKELDLLLYRLGLYADWELPGKAVGGAEGRAAFVYVTDTGHNASLPGYEFDLEPRLQSHYFPVGYSKILLHRAPLLENGGGQSRLDYQLRAWLHLEGGDVQDADGSWAQTGGSFVRLGAMAQFQLNAPRVFLNQDFSLTVLGSYLPAITGPEDHDWFLKVTAALTLLQDKERNHKISLSAVYQRGGVTFTKEEVDLLTLGLSVLF